MGSLFSIVKIPFQVFRDILKMLLIYLPGPTGIRLRRLYYQRKFKSCGVNLIVEVGVSIDGADLISVGDNVFIDKSCNIATGREVQGKIFRRENKDFFHEEGEFVLGSNIHICQGCILIGYGGFFVGDNSVFSAGCRVYSLTNLSSMPEKPYEIISIQPYHQAPFLISPVVFNKNTWLGLNTIVMPGVSVGRNSFVTSNSLLLDSYPENSYISGQPAKKIKHRFSQKPEQI
mgnify:CR=1 FL=1